MNQTECHQSVTGHIFLENVQDSFEALWEVMTSHARVCRALITTWLLRLSPGKPAI